MVSIIKNVFKIFDCFVFDVFVNEEYLLVVVFELVVVFIVLVINGGLFW